MTCEDLRKVSELSRSVIIDSLQSSSDPELDRGVFEATMKKVEKGFLEGSVCRSSLPPGSTFFSLSCVCARYLIFFSPMPKLRISVSWGMRIAWATTPFEAPKGTWTTGDKKTYGESKVHIASKWRRRHTYLYS